MLFNRQRKKEIALIYRIKQNDYSFPKGHLEEGEDIKSAALRETAEETKRKAIIIEDFEPFIEKYTTPRGENCACYMYVAIDNGPSNNNSEDTHDVYWTPFEKVEDVLSCENLKNTWRAVKDNIKSVL